MRVRRSGVRAVVVAVIAALYVAGLVVVAGSGEAGRSGAPPVAVLTAVNRLADPAVERVAAVLSPSANDLAAAVGGHVLPSGSRLSIQQRSWRQVGATGSLVVDIDSSPAPSVDGSTSHRRIVVMREDAGKWMTVFSTPSLEGANGGRGDAGPIVGAGAGGAVGPGHEGDRGAVRRLGGVEEGPSPCQGMSALGPAPAGNTVPVVLIPDATNPEASFDFVAASLVGIAGVSVLRVDDAYAGGAWVADAAVADRLAADLACARTTAGQPAIVVANGTGALAARAALALPAAAGSVQAVVPVAALDDGIPLLGSITPDAVPFGIVALACDHAARIFGEVPFACSLRSEADGQRSGPLLRALRPGSDQLTALPPWPDGLPRFPIAGDLHIGVEVLDAYRTDPAPFGDGVAGPPTAGSAGAGSLTISCAAPLARLDEAPCGHARLLEDSGTVARIDAIAAAIAQRIAVPPPVTPLHYAALGDSFASGEGAVARSQNDGDVLAGSQSGSGFTDDGGACGRNDQAWPRLVALVLRSPIEHLACSGAEVSGVVGTVGGDGSGGDGSGGGTQLASLVAAPGGPAALITVMVGGNDAGYSRVVAACAIGPDRCDRTDPATPAIAQAAVRIRAGFARLRAAVPASRILVVTYPKLLGPQSATGCSGLDASEVAYLNQATERLDDVIARAATDAGFEVVDIRDAFFGHEMCSGLGAMVNPFPATDLGSLAGAAALPTPFHPSARGYVAMASIVADVIANPPR